MAAPNDNLNDPRWTSLDSQSLPDRPAHPDPSLRTVHGAAEEVPSHGIFGHLDAKIGLTSDAQLEADAARYHAGVADSLEREQQAVQARVDAGDNTAKADVKAVRAAVDHHRGLAKGSQDVELSGGDAVREAILSGEMVPSVGETAVEGSQEGKRSDVQPENAAGLEGKK
jgi:hypothetical protein